MRAALRVDGMTGLILCYRPPWIGPKFFAYLEQTLVPTLRLELDVRWQARDPCHAGRCNDPHSKSEWRAIFSSDLTGLRRREEDIHAAGLSQHRCGGDPAQRDRRK